MELVPSLWEAILVVGILGQEWPSKSFELFIYLHVNLSWTALIFFSIYISLLDTKLIFPP